jgi:hypothetical protein
MLHKLATVKKHTRAAALFVLLPSAVASAEHHGRVMFNGLPVPGATVTVSQGAKRFETVTDAQGLFQFAEITNGEWTVHVEMLGFVADDYKLTLEASSPASLIELKMQSLPDLLAASRAAVVVAPKLLVPAAPSAAKATKTTKAAGTADTPDAPPVQAVADRNDGGMLINGSENNAATSKYTISPAFGTRRAGAKSLYTGSVGANVSNAVFDARPYSLTGLQVPKASYNRFTGVATLGGPLKIPRLMRNGPTFFIGYQWTRDQSADTSSGLVPTLAQRSGDLSNTLTAQGQPVTIADPNTGKVLTGPIAVSPQAQALLQLYPLPNLDGNTRYNYQTQVLSGTHSDALQSRLDKSFGRRDSVYGSFGFRSVRGNTQNLFHFLDTTNTLGIDSNVNWSHRFPHQFLMLVGYSFTRQRTDVRPNFAGVRNVSGDAGINGNEQSATNWGPPNLSFSGGITGLSDAQSAFNRNRTDRVSVSTTWTHRRHVVTFGGDFRRQEFNLLTQANPRGSFGFTSAATQSATAGTSGSDFADFLLGTPDTSAVAFGNADKYFRQSVYDGFATDDWRIRPELTISAGVRWDYGAPLTELFGRLVNLDVAQGFSKVAPLLGTAPVGTLTQTRYPTSLVRPDKSQVQPRVGLSWRPFPTSSTVVRAGYGIYVDTSVYLPSTTQMAQQAPLSTSLSVSRSSACPLTLANGFLNCNGTTSQTFALDPNFRVGYAQTWRLSVQNDLPGAIVLTATYLGTKGTHGPQEFLPNTNPIGSSAVCAACPRGFVYRTSGGNSIRHAGEVQLRRRLRSGLTATLDYVYAKSIDNDSSLGGTGYVPTSSTTTAGVSTTESIAQNWLDLRAERSRSSFDQRHLLKFQVQYTTGQGLGGGALLGGWRGRLLKEWTISSQLSAGTGLPQTPVYYAAVPDTGFAGTIRGSLTGQPIYGGPSGYHLNSAAYAAPAAGQWGTAGRNSIEGPNSLTLDSSLARAFRLREPLNLDVRVDATNLLNHGVFTGWNNTINSTTFGLPASTQAMRSLQISGRLRF